MATSFNFGNKLKKIPGSYSRIESGVKNPPIGLDFGALLVIDTGEENWGGGAGINGEFSTDKDSIQTFDNIQSFREHVKGGLWWDLALPLFRPSSLGINGVSSITFVRAATTIAAKLELTFTGGDTDGGTVELACKDEGVVGNGILDGTKIARGFSVKMVAGSKPDTYRLRFFQGTFRGLDYAGDPIGGISQAQSQEKILFETENFDNVNQITEILENNREFNRHFHIVEIEAAGDGSIDSGDLTANTAHQLFSGGTSTYSNQNLEQALEAVKDLTIDFILCDKYGSEALDANNQAIIESVVQDFNPKPCVYVAGENNAEDFEDSLAYAESFDSQFVSVVHGGIRTTKRTGGIKNSPSIYLAAYILGREAGLEPQVPLTFKGINIQGLTHQLNKEEKELALDAGVLTVVDSFNSFDVLKGINTLQNNRFLLNEDGTTHSKQLRRIIRQINKELVILSREQLLKQPDGVNRNTLSEQDLKNWVETYLLSITATETDDNLILGFQDVSVERNQDAYFVSYGIEVNTEVSFLFFTGTIITI